MDKDIDLKIIEEEFPPLILDSVKSNKEGVWREFKRDMINEATKMYNSVQGKKTGWKIGRSVENSISQIRKGNTYIYYEKDDNGELNPKIKIGYICNQLFDVRGTDLYESLSKEYIMIASAKLEELRRNNKTKSGHVFTDAYNAIRSYFVLAYLGKHPKTPVSSSILSGLYNERYHGFSYTAPNQVPIYDDMRPIYEDILSKRDKNKDEEIMNSALEKNKKFTLNFKK